jgi:FlaA1/EpsC-like NDP-sugar epimerase
LIEGGPPEIYGKIKRVLIVGAGDAGEKILREIFDNRQLNYKVIGFIDDDPQKQNRTIHGMPVLGYIEDLTMILDKREVDEVLIAIPSATGEQMKRVVNICKENGVSYKTLPGIGELIDGRVSVKALRDVSYQDLLGRPPVQLDISEIRNCIDGRAVLVTGCGGSIGSELCRQLVRFQPSSLILMDSSESNLFHIQMELQYESYFQKCHAVLGRVQNKSLMNEVFQKYRPQVVFHAAAYKHVPMLEKNPWKAVFNNIEGSKVTMEMAVEHGVDRFVLVSTDKAVRPTNIMGASKRITELILQSLQGNGTRFMAVRFGNVVGSSGSVVPLFRRQIEQGGPVTVTHPDVTRYFMTIPEAAQLIIQASAMGEGGEVFILEMGTPVKIADMARDLIRLSGKDPDRNIQIVFTGLRDGEKLYEELITVGEGIVSTGHEKIMVLRCDGQINGFVKPGEFKDSLKDKLAQLIAAAEDFDGPAIKQIMREIAPEYSPQNVEDILGKRKK